MNTFTLFNILSNIFQYLPHFIDSNLVWIVRNLCANTLAMGINSLIMQKLWLDLLHHPYKFIAIVRYISFKLVLWTPLSILVVARLLHILDQFLRCLSSYGKFCFNFLPWSKDHASSFPQVFNCALPNFM